LRRRVFQRFDMRHTSLTWQPDSANNQADGYTSTGEPSPHPDRVRAATASSMDTTIEVYARFVAGFVRGEGLSAMSRKAMTTPQGAITPASQFPPFRRNYRRGCAGRISQQVWAWSCSTVRKGLDSSGMRLELPITAQMAGDDPEPSVSSRMLSFAASPPQLRCATAWERIVMAQSPNHTTVW